MSQDLIKRLEEATGGSRDLDAEIALANGWHVYAGDNWISPDGKIVVPEYTRSIDAAVALAELVLGEDAALMLLANAAEEVFEDNVNGTIKDLPRIICITILKAKEAQDVQ